MMILEDQADGDYIIRAYKPGLVTINDETYSNSVIISANTLINHWPPQTIADLTTEHWAPVLALQPDFVLLGTGDQFTMPKASTLAPIYQQGLSVECMDTGAACRTFIALQAEGRNVVGALLIKSP